MADVVGPGNVDQCLAGRALKSARPAIEVNRRLTWLRARSVGSTFPILCWFAFGFSTRWEGQKRLRDCANC
jgi:hypothetical protein